MGLAAEIAEKTKEIEAQKAEVARKEEETRIRHLNEVRGRIAQTEPQIDEDLGDFSTLTLKGQPVTVEKSSWDDYFVGKAPLWTVSAGGNLIFTIKLGYHIQGHGHDYDCDMGYQEYSHTHHLGITLNFTGNSRDATTYRDRYEHYKGLGSDRYFPPQRIIKEHMIKLLTEK